MALYKEAWGFSKLNTYRACPAQFKYQYIDKLKMPESEALKRGSLIHDQLQMFLNGWAKGIPADIADTFWEKRLKVLQSKRPLTEQAWGVDKKWAPLDNWLHKSTWLRAKSDVTLVEKDVLDLIDFKTGQYRVPTQDQVELYAIVGHCFYPQVKKVRTQFWFVDQEAEPHVEVYPVTRLLQLRKKYEAQVEALYSDKTWATNPGAACRYCPFSRQRGGRCKY